ncbi:hypothetical protein Trydic_g5371 [Trypoxylus dichotomus]
MNQFLILIFFVATGIYAQQNYIPAVMEYSPPIRDPTYTDIEYVAVNVRRYVEFIQQAVTRQAHIVVFPEYGLTTTNLPADLINLSTTVPDPADMISPCANRPVFEGEGLDIVMKEVDSTLKKLDQRELRRNFLGVHSVALENLPSKRVFHNEVKVRTGPKIYEGTLRTGYNGIVLQWRETLTLVLRAGIKPVLTFFTDLSCAANEHRIFVVVNLIERAKNRKNATIYYNTNVVFASNGAVIARYRKINLFNEHQLTAGNEVVTFKGFNNITFGLFTSFDILFKTPAQDVLDSGATDIIYPTAWTSETPFLHSFSIQDGYAKSNGVNLLVSGYNNVSNGMVGAAIFSADGTIVLSSVTPAAAQNIFSGTLNVITRRSPEAVCNSITIGDPRTGLLPELTDVLKVIHENMELYSFQNLPLGVNKISGQICSEGTYFCCKYDIRFNTAYAANSTIYKMVAFFGRRGFPEAKTTINTIGVGTCALVHCSSEDNMSCGQFNARTNVNFESVRISTLLNPRYSSYQPATLDTNHSPLTGFRFCTIDKNVEIDLQVNDTQTLFSFGIFVRVHSFDGLPQGRGAASTAHLNFVKQFHYVHRYPFECAIETFIKTLPKEEVDGSNQLPSAILKPNKLSTSHLSRDYITKLWKDKDTLGHHNGNATVIVDTRNYKDKMRVLLQDSTRFKRRKDSTIALERKISAAIKSSFALKTLHLYLLITHYTDPLPIL